MNQGTGTKDQETSETTPALDVEPILAIHGDPRGFIGFVRKPDPDAPPRLDKNGNPYQFEQLFSIRVEELRSMFPALASWLTHDSYFTVNAYHRAAPFTNKQTGLPDVWRKEKHLQSLNACYADIDSGRPESDEPGAALDWREAQHEAEALADAGIIPQPSIMARSGRGVYLFWLLRDTKDPDKTPHAWPEKITLYKACNRALTDRLRRNRLPADLAAIDAARVLRVPGSIHRKARRRVGYVIQLDENGRGFTYTLQELAAALDIQAIDGNLPEEIRRLAKPIQYRRVKSKGSTPARARGAQALNALRAQDLLTLSTVRGGFKKRGGKHEDGSTSPGRRFILTLYTNFLRGSGLDQDKALETIRAMAATMRPPYPSDPTDQALKLLVEEAYKARSRRRWSNETLCGVLSITVDQARALDLQTVLPPEVNTEKEAALPLQAELIQERRAFAQKFLDLYGAKTTARKLAKAYREQDFIGANHQTANMDLNALRFKARDHKGGRPRKAL